VTLGINLPSVQKILKCGDSNDVLTLATNDDNSELKFRLEGGSRCFEFSMALMDIDSERLIIPDSEPETTVRLSAVEFQRICRDLTQFGDTVKISVVKSTVTFSLVGSAGNGAITLGLFDSDKSENQAEIECSAPIELSFGLRYLNFFTKATPLAERVELQMAMERPLLVLFELADGAGYIRYYLAPKVDDEAGE
jgi:proliferating cell nuclear antigen